MCVCVCVHMNTHLHSMMQLWKPEDNWSEPWLSFHHVGPREGTHACSQTWQQDPCLLSHPTSPNQCPPLAGASICSVAAATPTPEPSCFCSHPEMETSGTLGTFQAFSGKLEVLSCPAL